MAKRINCKKGFKVISLTPKEAKTIGFGIHEGCLCMECNNIIKDNIYYIAALNDVMDEECFNNWLETAIHYSEDARVEDSNFLNTCYACTRMGINVENL